MRRTRRLKPRFFTILALGLCLLASFAAHTPAAAQDAAQPEVIESKAPAYPRIAEVARLVGTVLVEVEVDAGGHVTAAKAKGAHGVLLKAAEEAAARWRFAAAGATAAGRTALLTFEFESEPTCDGAPVFRSPYHVVLAPAYRLGAHPDTESQVPQGFERMRCPVHRQRFKVDKLEIIYGLTIFDPSYLKVKKQRFPYANSVSYGGCVIEGELNPCTGKQVTTSPTYAEVLYCPRCRLAEQSWAKRHQGRRG